MKVRSFYTDGVTKDLMEVCKRRCSDIESLLKKEERPENSEILWDELIAIVDLMSYIDTRHKDYLLEKLIDRKKAALKATWQSFKLRIKKRI